MILGTSIVGGYIVMRGAAVIFGNYIDEDQFVDLIKSGEYEQIRDMKNGWVYAYLGLWLVTAFITNVLAIRKKKQLQKKLRKSKKMNISYLVYNFYNFNMYLIIWFCCLRI